MIYTSYFAVMDKVPAKFVPVSICLYQPKWYTGRRFPQLAPPMDMFTEFKRTGDIEMFSDALHQYYTNLDCQSSVAQLEYLAGSKDIVLLCYEKSTDFCHRHIVSEWLTRHDIPCREYTFA